MSFRSGFFLLVFIVVLIRGGFYLFKRCEEEQGSGTSPSSQKTGGGGRRAARLAYDLSRRSEFTVAVSQLQKALTQRAHSDALAQIAEVDALLARYKAAGTVPLAFERELEDFVQRNALALASVSDDVGRALAALLAAYVPTSSLRYWWDTKALPWLRDDAL